MQTLTLSCFSMLLLQQADWRGKLILSRDFDQHGMALAFAALGVGGACLTLEEDAHRMRVAGHAGASDFTVATLSEALRILKNELRKGASISVALRGNPDIYLRQMLERGVQPDYVAGPAETRAAHVDAFVTLGACRLQSAAPATTLAEAIVVPGWQIADDVAATAGERKSRDRALAVGLDGDPAQNRMDGIARRWMQVAPRLFPRDQSRAYLRKDHA